MEYLGRNQGGYYYNIDLWSLSVVSVVNRLISRESTSAIFILRAIRFVLFVRFTLVILKLLEKFTSII